MIIQRVDKRFKERKSEFILEKDKDKLLTKADALTIFATKEELANTKSEIIKCPPDRTGRDVYFLDRNNWSAFGNYVCHAAFLFEIIFLFLEIINLKKIKKC